MRKLLRFLLVPIILGMMSAGSFAFEVPALKSRVNDYAGLLSEPQVKKLEDALRALEERTTAQVAILTVKDLQGEPAPVDFAQKVFTAWKLGQKDKDNGLLILYTVKEDRYRIHTGYGMEPVIPDGVAGDIMRKEMRPRANPQKGLRDFDGAFMGAVEAIIKRIDAAHEAEKTPAAPAQEGGMRMLPLLLSVVILGVAVLLGASSHTMVGGAVGALGEGALASFFFSLPGVLLATLAGAALAAVLSDLLLSLRNQGPDYAFEPAAPRSSGRSRSRSRAGRRSRSSYRESSRSTRRDDDSPGWAPSSSSSDSGFSSGSSDSGGFSGGGGTSGGGGADG